MSIIAYNYKMNIKNEIKSLIAKNATTLKEVCSNLEKTKGEKISPNNITNKLRRNTIKFNEVEEILDILGYNIEFIKKS